MSQYSAALLYPSIGVGRSCRRCGGTSACDMAKRQWWLQAGKLLRQQHSQGVRNRAAVARRARNLIHADASYKVAHPLELIGPLVVLRRWRLLDAREVGCVHYRIHIRNLQEFDKKGFSPAQAEINMNMAGSCS